MDVPADQGKIRIVAPDAGEADYRPPFGDVFAVRIAADPVAILDSDDLQ
jgi:hypothetical protein